MVKLAITFKMKSPLISVVNSRILVNVSEVSKISGDIQNNIENVRLSNCLNPHTLVILNVVPVVGYKLQNVHIFFCTLSGVVLGVGPLTKCASNFELKTEMPTR